MYPGISNRCFRQKSRDEFLKMKNDKLYKSPDTSSPGVLLLAAGRARRFGSDKRMALTGSRLTLLEQSISLYMERALPVYVCLSARAEDDELESIAVAAGASVLRCAAAQGGMGCTIAEAAGRVPMHPALFIALADMPAVASGTLTVLRQNAAADRVVYPVYRGRRGHPVVFGSQFFSLLQNLEGDRGASLILTQHASRCVALPVDDPGVLLDADTPEQLARLSAVIQARNSSGVSG